MGGASLKCQPCYLWQVVLCFWGFARRWMLIAQLSTKENVTGFFCFHSDFFLSFLRTKSYMYPFCERCTGVAATVSVWGKAKSFVENIFKRNSLVNFQEWTQKAVPRQSAKFGVLLRGFLKAANHLAQERSEDFLRLCAIVMPLKFVFLGNYLEEHFTELWLHCFGSTPEKVAAGGIWSRYIWSFCSSGLQKRRLQLKRLAVCCFFSLSAVSDATAGRNECDVHPHTSHGLHEQCGILTLALLMCSRVAFCKQNSL